MRPLLTQRADFQECIQYACHFGEFFPLFFLIPSIKVSHKIHFVIYIIWVYIHDLNTHKWFEQSHIHQETIDKQFELYRLCSVRTLLVIVEENSYKMRPSYQRGDCFMCFLYMFLPAASIWRLSWSLRYNVLMVCFMVSRKNKEIFNAEK